MQCETCYELCVCVLPLTGKDLDSLRRGQTCQPGRSRRKGNVLIDVSVCVFFAPPPSLRNRVWRPTRIECRGMVTNSKSVTPTHFGGHIVRGEGGISPHVSLSDNTCTCHVEERNNCIINIETVPTLKQEVLEKWSLSKVVRMWVWWGEEVQSWSDREKERDQWRTCKVHSF